MAVRRAARRDRGRRDRGARFLSRSGKLEDMPLRRPASLFSRTAPRRFGFAALAFAAVGAGLMIFSLTGKRHPEKPAPEASSQASLSGLAAILPSPSPAADPADTPPAGALSGKFLFFEDFEHSGDRWTLAGAPGQGGFHRLKAPACGGLYTMHVGRTDNQPFSPGSFKTSVTQKAQIDLTQAKRPLLRFDVKGDFAPEGSLVLQPMVQVDDGAWQPLGRPTKGRYQTVLTRFVLLEPYKGHKIRLRFEATVEPTTKPTVGYYLDDIYVLETAKP